jgi:arylsulfatase A
LKRGRNKGKSSQKPPGQTVDLAKEHPELLGKLKSKLLKINASIMADGADWHLDK